MPNRPWSVPIKCKPSIGVAPSGRFLGAPYTAPFRLPVKCVIVRGVNASRTVTWGRKFGANDCTAWNAPSKASSLAVAYAASSKPFQCRGDASTVMRAVPSGSGSWFA